MEVVGNEFGSVEICELNITFIGLNDDFVDRGFGGFVRGLCIIYMRLFCDESDVKDATRVVLDYARKSHDQNAELRATQSTEKILLTAREDLEESSGI